MTVTKTTVNPLPTGGIIRPRYPAPQDVPSVPAGGSTGQALIKTSGTDYDIEWGTVSGGGGSGGGALVPVAQAIVIGSSTNSIPLSGLPQIYRSLIIEINGRGDGAAFSAEVRMRMNGDTGNNYDYQSALMNQSNDADIEGRAAAFILLGYLTAASSAANHSGSIFARLPNYKNTTFYKTVLAQNYLPARVDITGFVYNDVEVGAWRSASAITDLTVYLASGNFVAGTVLTVWGLLDTVPTTPSLSSVRYTASHTLVLGDAGVAVEMNVGSANNLTIPTNATVAFPVGTIIEICQYGAGQTTIVAAGGVTLRNPASSGNLRAQYSTCSIRQTAVDEWIIAGDLS